MWMNEMLGAEDGNSREARLVILEAALEWIRHEAHEAHAAVDGGRRAMERIEWIAAQILDEDETTMVRMRRHLAREQHRAQRSA